MAKDINVWDIGYTCLQEIKHASWFPYASGNLKFNATHGIPMAIDMYLIHFSGTVAPYIEALEEGSGPHDIPGAFGIPAPFGVGGRFDGKFHPGSTKHVGFIKNKSVGTIINYICVNYKGVCYDFN